MHILLVIWNGYSSQASFYILQNNKAIIIFPVLGESPLLVTQSKSKSVISVQLNSQELVLFVQMEGKQAGTYFSAEAFRFFHGHSFLHTDQLLWVKFCTPSKYQFIIDTIQDASMALKGCSRNCYDVALCVSSVLLFKSCSWSGQNCI